MRWDLFIWSIILEIGQNLRGWWFFMFQYTFELKHSQVSRMDTCYFHLTLMKIRWMIELMFCWSPNIQSASSPEIQFQLFQTLVGNKGHQLYCFTYFIMTSPLCGLPHLDLQTVSSLSILRNYIVFTFQDFMIYPDCMLSFQTNP